MDNTVASAAVAAVIATSVTLVVNHLKKAQDAKAHQAEVCLADQLGHQRGWYEGRESVIQHMADRPMPKEFTPIN